MSQPNPDREENMPVAATPDAASPAAYRIEEDEDDLIFRVPKTLATRERVSRFLDWLEFEQLRSRSDLTEEDAAELAAEVKRAVWEQAHDHGGFAGNAKERALDAIRQLPAEANVEEMMEKLYFLSKVERGLRQIDAGQVVSHEEAKRRFGR